MLELPQDVLSVEEEETLTYTVESYTLKNCFSVTRSVKSTNEEGSEEEQYA